MASTWWDQAYSSIVKTPVKPNQQNQDWGAMRDAFRISTAEKGLNYELTRALSASATNDEKGLMQLSADLDRRNTLDLMAGEQKFKIEGLSVANALSKDYLAAEGAQSRANISAQGEQDRSLQQVQNEGAMGVANIKAGSDKYTADRSLQATESTNFANKYIAETQEKGATERTGIQESGATERTGMQLQSQERQIGLTGDENRKTISKQAEEDRYSVRDGREHAAGLATRMSRR